MNQHGIPSKKRREAGLIAETLLLYGPSPAELILPPDSRSKTLVSLRTGLLPVRFKLKGGTILIKIPFNTCLKPKPWCCQPYRHQK